jgi:hypothetical protein
MQLLLAFLVAVQDSGVQKVVAEIAEAARENAAKPEKDRATGDALAELYIRRACESGQPARAVLLGVGYALEPAGLLAANPLARDAFKDVESPEQRKERRAVMGRPTLRGREDWLVHFVVSAALVPIVGENAAEAIGVQKEVSDAKRKEEGDGSGFSFTDLNADFAGVAFAVWLVGKDSKHALEKCARSFEGAGFVPDPEGLADGLTWSEFLTTWGGVADARFRAECDRLRSRVRECKGYDSG